MWLRRLGQMLLRRLGQRPLRRLGQVDHRFLSPVTVDNHPRLAALLLSHRTAPDVYGFGFTRGSRARSMLFSVQRGLCHPVGITFTLRSFAVARGEHTTDRLLAILDGPRPGTQLGSQDQRREWAGKVGSPGSRR